MPAGIVDGVVGLTATRRFRIGVSVELPSSTGTRGRHPQLLTLWADASHIAWGPQLGLRPSTRGSTAWMCRKVSDDADVLGFFALASGPHVELDGLTLFKSLVTLALNVGEVNEDVVPVFPRNESEALL